MYTLKNYQDSLCFKCNTLIITFNIIVQIEGHSDVKIQFYKRKLT